MKEKTIIWILLSLLVFTLRAQQNLPLSVFSDRDTYVSGETMLVKVFAPANDQSKINYLDILNQRGERVSGSILEINNHQADGYLFLPDSLSNGTYILRSYTKSTNQIKMIKEIWITNRFNGLEKIKQIPRLASIPVAYENAGFIKISNFQPTLNSISDYNLTFEPDQTLINEIDGNISICISQSDNHFKSTSSLVLSGEKNQAEVSESKGLILSGKITDKKTLQPASRVNVFFTIPDSIPEFQYYQTKDDGKFYFQLSKYSGSIKPFIQCFSTTPLQRLKITIDDSFTGSEIIPAMKPMAVTDTFTVNNAKNIDIVTFQKVFEQQPFQITQTSTVKTETYPYYGKPNKVINPHLFIDLPNFTEVSRELLTGVKFRNYNNEPTLQVLNVTASGYFDEIPLTLIDGIPIRDLNLIKDMGTQDIKRVEICNAERYYGNLKFPGVVAIYTTKADYSNIKETDQFIHPTLDAVQPKITLSKWDKKDTNIPDLRQVLYWEPSIKPQNVFRVNFKTSSVLGKFKVSIWCRLKNGTIVSEEKQFEVL